MTFQHIGCALRNTRSVSNPDGKFELIDDVNHLPVGFDRTAGSVTHTAANGIKVLYDQTFQQVVSVVVAPDEVMAAQGVVCGASVGLSYLIIFCYKNGVLLDPDAMNWASSNLWVYGLMKCADE